MNALEPGSTLGGYRILARLRAGAMGVLYLARRIGPAGFSRPVAIKVIHDHLALNKRFCRMFIDEAKLSARIDDPNVVRVDEFAQADGRYYLVMEYVHGASLAQTIAVLRKRGGIPIEQAVAIAIQMASGLHGAHQATDEEGAALGIVHRDVSPHNVLVSYKGSVRIIDFGIAKARQVGGQTKTGSLRGKLAYMPPEQARSARTVDRRADLYGVALVLWEMLTFRRVFDADTDIAILNQIRDPQILPPSTLAPAVPKALDDIVMRTLDNDPDKRPATGAALQRALADAVPGALRVLPGDLAALMKKVRVAAEAVAGGGDDASSYGEEVRGTLRTFGANMNDSVELAKDALSTRPSSPDLDEDAAAAQASSAPPAPRVPSAASPGASQQPPRIPTVRMTVEEEKTMRRQQPARPATDNALRPGDGVRRLVPTPPPSSADVLIPPPPLSSSRALVPPAPLSSSSVGRPSYGDMVVAQPSSPDLGMGSMQSGEHPSPEPPRPASLAQQKVMLAIVGPVVVAVGIAIVVLVSGRSEVKTSTAAAPVRDAAAAVKSAAPIPEAPALIAPVVIAPPEPPPQDEPADAGTGAKPAAKAPRRGGRQP